MKTLRSLRRKTLRTRQHPRGRRGRSDLRTRTLAFEPLEDRRLLSTINWTNRTTTTGTNDNRFDDVFGTLQSQAVAVVDAAISYWARVIDDFNYNDNTNTYNITISMNASAQGSGPGGVGANGGFTGNIGGKPSVGNVGIGWRSGITPGTNTAAAWYLDPTPTESSEFQAIGANFFNAFARRPSIALGGADLFTGVLHELGHAMGLAATTQTRGVAVDTATADNVSAPASTPPSTLWVLNSSSLWTEWDSGGASGTAGNFNGPQHFAPLGTSAVVNDTTYFGAVALMNASFTSRSFISDLEADAARVAYDYAIIPPSSFGTMYDTLDSDGTLRVNVTNLINSDDFLEIDVTGGNLRVSLDTGSPVAGIDPFAAISSTFPLASVQRIQIDMGSGADVVRINPIGSAIPITIVGGDGNNRLEIVGAEAAYDSMTVDSPRVTSTGVDITSFGEFQTITLYTNGGDADIFMPRTGALTVGTIHDGFGNETLNLHTLDTATPVTINALFGSDTINIAPAANTYAIRSDLTINGSAQDNVINLASAAGFGALQKPITVNGNGGNDSLNLAPNSLHSPSVIQSAVTFNGGDGDDTLNIGNGYADSVTANITFDGGETGGGANNKIVFHDTLPTYQVAYDIGSNYVTRDGLLEPMTVTQSNTQVINIQGGGGKDIVTVRSGATVTVQAFGYGGNDEFTIGDGTVGFQPASIYNGGDGTDTIKFDDSQSTANSTTMVQPNLVSFFGGVFSVGTDSFETVNCYTGIGDNTVRIEGAISQNLYVATGAGTDELIATDYSNQFLDGFGFTTYDANFDLGTGLNYLTVDETDGFLTSFDLYPTRLAYADFLPLAKTDFNFFNVTGGLTIDASDDANTVRVYGTRPLLSVFEDTISTNGGNDQIFLYPHDGAGNTTIKGGLRINGGDSPGDLEDTLFIDDSAAGVAVNYTFNNQAGSGVANIVGPGTFGAGSDVELIIVTTGGGNDTFNINSFQSGSLLSISAGSGDDTCNFGVSNLTAEITNIGPFGFAGQTGADTLNINNTTHPNPFTYSRPFGGGGLLFMSNAFGANYVLGTDLSLESMVLNAGAAADVFRINEVFPNTSLLMNGGAGLDALLLGVTVNSLDAIQGKMYFYGQAGGGYVSVSDSADPTGDIVHLDYIPANSFHAEQSSLGAHPGDNFFGAGGALYFTDIVNFGSFAGVTLDVGSGTDTIYASPLPNARVSINGNNPTSAPGDALKLALAQAQNYVVNNAVSPTTLIHEFTGGVNGGLTPYGTVILDGSTLYGTTEFGGDFNSGTVFRVNTDGTGFQLLHEFAAGVADGSRPIASVTLVGSTLYGVTRLGGDFNQGVVFRVNTDGTNFGILHEFLGGAMDGREPWGALAYDGATLYGTTTFGGQFSNGTVFRIGTNGGGFGILKSFGGPNDGRSPTSGVTLDGTVLYGTTSGGGGTGSVGTVYRLNTDGSGYQKLHSFLGGAADGSTPESAGVAVAGSVIYGTTTLGGDFNLGTVYRLNTDGMGFQLLHEFAGGSDGRQPYASPTLVGSTIYGTTVLGGSQGTVYRLNTDGTGYQIVHTFAGGAADGGQPRSSLTLGGSKFYGTTLQGGDFNSGTVFSLPVSGSGNVTSGNLQTLDWTNIEQPVSIDAVRPQIVSQSYIASPLPTIRVQFSEDVPQPLSASYLYLSNETTAQLIPASVMAVAYDATTDIADFTFPGLFAGRLPPGNYKAAIIGTLTDLFGNPVGNETFLMFTVTQALPGDFDNDGVVEQPDYNLWTTRFGQLVAPGNLGDGNGDGLVNAADYVLWRKFSDAGGGSAAEAFAANASAPTLQAVSVSFPEPEHEIVPSVVTTTIETPSAVAAVSSVGRLIDLPFGEIGPGGIPAAAKRLIFSPWRHQVVDRVYDHLERVQRPTKNDDPAAPALITRDYDDGEPANDVSERAFAQVADWWKDLLPARRRNV